jgi:uncharacterized protein YodC (DUF2158 family)
LIERESYAEAYYGDSLQAKAKTMTTFKIGDVVMLNSGGQKMTVTGTKDKKGVQHVWCAWNNDGKDETGSYPADALVSATSGEHRGPTHGRVRHEGRNVTMKEKSPAS